jgi:hypothetical protein
MTELERGQVIREWIALLQTQGQSINLDTTTMFAILSGCLLVAYFVGKELPTKQVLILSSLYIVGIFATLANLLGNALSAVAINGALLRVCPECETSPLTSVEGVALVMVVNVAMVSASLYFMWSIRNPKTE